MTLTDRIRAAIEAQKALAEAATPGPWVAKPHGYGPPEEGWGEPCDFEIYSPSGYPVVSHQPHEGGGIHGEPNAAHIAAWDPATALRHCEAGLAVLHRHRPIAVAGLDFIRDDRRLGCADRWADPTGRRGHFEPWPCADIRDLAESWGIPLEEQ